MSGDLAERLHAVRQWPGMVLPEQRYGALVAYVEGFIAGSGTAQLDGFQEWVVTHVLGRESSFHWSTIIAGQRNHRLLDGDANLSDLSPAESSDASEDLVDLLLRYLEERRAQ